MKLFKSRTGTGDDQEMSFIEHLDVLRGHLFRSALAVAVGAVVMAIYNKVIVQRILMGPTHLDFWPYTTLCSLGRKWGLSDKLCMAEIHLKMQSNAVSGQFDTYFNIILIGGCILACPLFLL